MADEQPAVGQPVDVRWLGGLVASPMRICQELSSLQPGENVSYPMACNATIPAFTFPSL